MEIPKAKQEKMSKIFKRILVEVKPTPLEIKSTTANVNILMSRLKKIVPRNVELMVAGSIARGTNLRGTADIDIFMLFDKSANKEKLSSLGLEYGKKLVDKKRKERYEIKYAEHPYVRLYLDEIGIRADIVPAQKIDNAKHLVTAVDRTPLHNEFIISHLSDKQKDDVRLLKHLLKAHNIYGAEIKVGGFSGYLCEILIYQFNSLTKLLESFSSLRIPVILNPKEKTIIRDENIAKKFQFEFVVIDPVDPNRNVAAAVSRESLSKFVLVARQLLSKPSADLFNPYKFSSMKTHKMLDDLMRRTELDYFFTVLGVPDKSPDIIWPQLRKVSNMITEYVGRFGFDIYISSQWLDRGKGVLLIISPKTNLKTKLMKGPDVFKVYNTHKFMEKHKDSFGFLINGSSVYSLDENRYENVEAIMREFAKGKIIKGHKEIKIKNALLFVNRIPGEYAETAFLEINKLLSI